MAGTVPHKVDVDRWTVEQVAAWLQQVELSDCGEVSLRRGIDGHTLLKLREEELVLWGRDVSIRNRKQIMKLVNQINSQQHLGTRRQSHELGMVFRTGKEDSSNEDDFSDDEYEDDTEQEPLGYYQQQDQAGKSELDECEYLTPLPAPNHLRGAAPSVPHLPGGNLSQLHITPQGGLPLPHQYLPGNPLESPRLQLPDLQSPRGSVPFPRPGQIRTQLPAPGFIRPNALPLSLGRRPPLPFPGHKIGPLTHGNQVAGATGDGGFQGGKFTSQHHAFPPEKADDVHDYEVVEISPRPYTDGENAGQPPSEVPPPSPPPPVLPPRNSGDVRDGSGKAVVQTGGPPSTLKRPPAPLPTHLPLTKQHEEGIDGPPSSGPPLPPSSGTSSSPSSGPFLSSSSSNPLAPGFLQNRSPPVSVNNPVASQTRPPFPLAGLAPKQNRPPFLLGGPSFRPPYPSNLLVNFEKGPQPFRPSLPPRPDKVVQRPAELNSPHEECLVPKGHAPGVPGGVDFMEEWVNLGNEETVILTTLLRTLMPFPFFHLIARAKSKNILEQADEGMFLVRPSTRSKDPLTLSLRHSSRTYNINIRQRGDGLFALGSQKVNEMTFKSVEELVSAHQQEPIKMQNGERTLLTTSPSKPPNNIYVHRPTLRKK